MNTPQELIEDIRAGKMVILVDDESRENEGDLVIAADHVNALSINFMAKEARGLICLALESEQIDRLGLRLMVDEGWRRFWAKRGGIPSLDVMDFTLSREIKELTAHQARLKKPVRAGKK